MIGFIKGKVVYVDGAVAVVDVNGVGYEIRLTERDILNVTPEKEVSYYIHTEVREDSISFYGFITFEEKKFFEVLRGVQGVGPKTAMNLLKLSVSELSEAIRTSDIKTLTSVHGLGKKGAERIVLELMNILPSSDTARKHGRITDEVVGALENLGYRRKDVEKVLEDLPQGVAEVEEIIKYFLKNVR